MAFDHLRADLARFAEIKGLPRWRAAIEGLLLDNGFLAVVLFRLAHWLRASGVPLLGPAVARWSLWLTGVDIAPSAQIGPGLYIAHGVGLVIGGGSRVGARAFLLHQATLGAPSQGRLDEMPTLGDEVFVGAGARIIGRVSIGDRALIGTNAVVTSDVPADCRATTSATLVIAPRSGEPPR